MSKTQTTAVAVAWLAVGGLCRAAPERIAIGVSGQIEPRLVERVRCFVADQYGAAVVARPVALTFGGGRSLADAAEAAKVGLGDGDICLVALAACPAEITQQGAVNPAAKTGVVNVTALKPAGQADGEQSERYERRVEKETARAVALLLGLPPCPFFRCCLFPHGTDEQLDAKSRNPCPPCLKRVDDALTHMGAKRLSAPEGAPPK